MLYETASVSGGANLYSYCLNNPIMFTDSEGYFLDIIWDAICVLWSGIEFILNPTEENFQYLMMDLIALSIPFVPAISGGLRIIKSVDKAIDAGKAVNKVDNFLTPYPKGFPKYPGNNPTKIPKGYEWRGSGLPGSPKGSYYNPKTREVLRPDLDHKLPIGPHWDYRSGDGVWYRMFPKGFMRK